MEDYMRKLIDQVKNFNKTLLNEESKGLWANIHNKKKRGEKPAKLSDDSYPDKKQWDRLTKESESSEDKLYKMMERLNPNSTKRVIKEENEGQYYRPKLEDIIKNSQEILNSLKDNAELEAWVQDKITISHHNIDAILNYMKSTKENVQDNDLIAGGNADKLSVDDLAKKHKVSPESIKQQIKKGKKIELEHTDDYKKAEEIPMDHQTEMPD